ncbi:Metal binding domain of Ada [Desulfacinum infernum DSM 9756]|uniref:Metal binding domain of Ada n=1 Tax=Desulfacinum infernum DSM 9756 TaxID=1121391 RepID=A0A1M5FME3_9BACT|nr:Metal binding domain of Ada [Desulfacinum infernum DSM 9756]
MITRRFDRLEAKKATLAEKSLFFGFLGGGCLAALIFLALSPLRAASLPEYAWVVRVYDGDTVLLDTGDKVRYLGIDAPEVDHEGGAGDCYALQAWRRNKGLVEGRKVQLRYDEVRRDEHGRLLAYVHTPDGRCVNTVLLREGCALVFRTPKGFERFREFLDAQRNAMKGSKGLWGECRVQPAPFYLGNQRSYVFHRPSCPFGTQTARRNLVRFNSRWDALWDGYRPCRRCRP